MKTLLLFFLGLSPLLGFPQVRDDFSDGNFSQNPQWIGDSTQFEVNTSKQLHLKSIGSDTSILVTQFSAFPEMEWNFWLKLSFNTSVNNNARIYLMSDVPGLKGPLNGFFLQVGGGNDSLSLVRQTGTTVNTLILAQDIFTGNSINTLRVKVTVDSTGLWEMYADQSGGNNYLEEGKYHGQKITGNAWFGIFVRYTSSNATKFYFDDFYAGAIIRDTIPPVVSSIRFENDHQITVKFSESILKNAAENTENYSMRQPGNPANVVLDTIDHSLVRLIYNEIFPSGFRDTLTVRNILDLAGNNMVTDNFPVNYYIPKMFDILINEIMADPEPSVGLPVCEYVELYNRTGFIIGLEGWVLVYGSYSKTFPITSIEPHGFLTLTKGFPLAGFGPTVDLFTSLSSLSNEGTTITLKNAEGSIIHSITYSPDWYGDPVKADGGWSLELIDIMNPCGCEDNWTACSYITGGTPGARNSCAGNNPDTVLPYLERSWLTGNSELDLLYSEPMDSTSLYSMNHWQTEPSVGHPDSIRIISPDFTRVRLFYSMSFEKDTFYRIIQQSGPKDCAGNEVDTTRICFAGIPDPPEPGDLVINEILPNPETNGQRFVELLNRSHKVIDLSQVLLSSFDTLSNVIRDEKEISTTAFLLFPGKYIVLTTAPSDIMNRYTTSGIECFVKMESFPSLSDNDGIVVVARKNDQKVVDKMNYHASMQYPLLNTTQGVSLERLNPEISSEDPGNWHSASESCGFATPGFKNSEYQNVVFDKRIVTLSPKVFSPDNDGKEDVLNIEFNFDSPGYLTNVAIFDRNGKCIRQLAKNKLMSTRDNLVWDGTDELHRKNATGIYILYFEMLKPDGTVVKLKKVAVIAQ